MPCSHHPILAKEAKAWKPLPAIQKPEKKPHNKSLIEIVADSMRNSVGILASLMTKCRFFNLTDEYAYLGEQIQLVVDSLKSDTGVDHDYIDTLGNKLKKLVDQQLDAHLVPWFCIYKDKTIFARGNVPTIALEHRHDTISQLFAAVGELYQSEDSPFYPGTNEQYSFLFEEIYPYLTPLSIAKCEKYYACYIKQVSDIINSFPPDGERTPAQEKTMGKLIGLVIDEWVTWADDLKTKLTDQQVMTIAAGFWKIIHSRRNTGSANIIFRMFPDQIASRLETFRGNSFRIRKGDEGMSAATYEDSPMLGMVVRVDDDYYLYIKDGDDYALFGEVISSALSGYSCIPMDRMEFPCMITTRYNKAGQPSYHEAVII